MTLHNNHNSSYNNGNNDTNVSVGIHLLRVNNRNTRTRCKIFSKLKINTPERRH